MFWLRTEVLPTAPQPSTEAALDGQASRYFAALDASIRGLQQRTQQLIDKVNDSRKEDHAVMSSFRESLLLKVGARERRGAAGTGGTGG